MHDRAVFARAIVLAVSAFFAVQVTLKAPFQASRKAQNQNAQRMFKWTLSHLPLDDLAKESFEYCVFRFAPRAVRKSARKGMPSCGGLIQRNAARQELGNIVKHRSKTMLSQKSPSYRLARRHYWNGGSPLRAQSDLGFTSRQISARGIRQEVCLRPCRMKTESEPQRGGTGRCQRQVQSRKIEDLTYRRSIRMAARLHSALKSARVLWVLRLLRSPGSWAKAPPAN